MMTSENQINQLAILEKKIGINFKNKDLLRQVFVHRSYLNENRSFDLEHNERLEFLGDAVLELVVTEYLFKNYLNPEGELTNWRAALVRGERISEVGVVLNFEEYLLLSHGESKNVGKAKKIILANTFEALVGAIYLDKGYKDSKKFIEKFLLVYFKEIIEKELYIDPKSRLQEMTQEKWGVTPIYEVVKEWGPDHAKNFLVKVIINNESWAEGEGASKQRAQTEAAANALTKWKDKESEE